MASKKPDPLMEAANKRAAASTAVVGAPPPPEDDGTAAIQDSLQADAVGSFYERKNAAKRRASLEMEESFADELSMFRQHDASIKVQCAWRQRASRCELAQRREWARTAEASSFLGWLVYRHHLARPHREAFREHRRRTQASVEVQRQLRGRIGRRFARHLQREKEKREHEAARQQLHEETRMAVALLNNQYERVDLKQVEDGQQRRPPPLEPEPEPEPELVMSPKSLLSPGSTSMLSPTSSVLSPTSSVGSPRRKGGLYAGRAPLQHASAATSNDRASTDQERQALVVSGGARFRAAGNKIRSLIKVSNLFTAGSPAQALAGGVLLGGIKPQPPAAAKPKAAAKPRAAAAAASAQPAAAAGASDMRPKKAKPRKARPVGGKKYAKATPRYLQHLEPKRPPPPEAATPRGAPLGVAVVGRKPGSGRGKLPPLGLAGHKKATGQGRA